MKQCLGLVLLLAAGIFYCSCSSNKRELNLDANRNVVRKYHEVWSNGNVAELDSIMAPDFVCHFINGIEWKGIEGTKNSISSHRKSFPDWKEEIADLISEGDKVVTRYKSTGTQLAKFHQFNPTGKHITIYETSIYRISNGKIAEQWGFPDAQSLDNQLEGKN